MVAPFQFQLRPQRQSPSPHAAWAGAGNLPLARHPTRCHINLLTPAWLLFVYCLLILLGSLAGGLLPLLLSITHRWMEMVVSFVAGVMLAGVAATSEPGVGLRRFPLPLLAMLGGFSATLVYRVLQRLVSAVESIMDGNARAANVEAIERIKAKLGATAQGERLELLDELHRVRRHADESPELADAIDRMLARISDAPDSAAPRAGSGSSSSDARQSDGAGGPS